MLYPIFIAPEGINFGDVTDATSDTQVPSERSIKNAPGSALQIFGDRTTSGSMSADALRGG
jgi:hypothetical protein